MKIQIFSIVVFSLVLFNCTHGSLESGDSRDVASLSATDKTKLSAVVEGRRVVGLGEGSHYSDGLNRLRSVLLKHLIEEKGFRRILIETQDSSVASLRNYVVSDCSEMKTSDFGSIFAGWITPVTKNFFQWLCEYNKTNSENAVAIEGFEINSMGVIGAQRIHQFLLTKGKIFPKRVKLYNEKIKKCLVGGVGIDQEFDLAKEKGSARKIFQDVYTTKSTSYDPSSLKDCEIAIGQVNEIAKGKSLSSKDKRELKIAVNQLETENKMLALQLLSKQEFDPDSVAMRDKGMAADILLRLESGEKAILWAATAHLNKNSTTKPKDYSEKELWVGQKLMGQILSEKLGSNYSVIHLTAKEIKHRCSKRYSYCKSEDVEVISSPADHLESIVVDSATHPGPYFILSTSRLIKSHQGTLKCNGLRECSSPEKHFDAVYILESSEARADLKD